MFHPLRMTAFAKPLSGSPRLRRIFVKFSGFVVIDICHLGYYKFSSQGATTRRSMSRSWKSRDGVVQIAESSNRPGHHAPNASI
jgi:hypothetical protein